ncbi:MAG: M91 family zinc metallopeptidase [Candidatus Bruticola sp.]
MSITSVHKSIEKSASYVQKQENSSIKGDSSAFSSLKNVGSVSSSGSKDTGVSSALSGSTSTENVQLSSEASKISLSAFSKKDDPFVMTDASAYPEGSDVQEMAYAMAGESDRSKVDLSDYTVLKASSADNQIQISKRDGGGLIVNVDGQEQEFTAAEARNLIIDGGYGNDNIIADDDVKSALYIVGGRGDDTITTGQGADIVYDNYGANTISTKDGNDTVIANQLDYENGTASKEDNRNIFQKLWDKITGNDEYEHAVKGNIIDGGAGSDYLEGGLGEDIISGGEGNDVIYGLDGSDKISGGDGDDYIDGGRGNDTISGGEGTDRLFGGRGDDIISGGDGDDVIAGGLGKDTVSGGAGANKITADSDDTVSAGSEGSVSYLESVSVPKEISVEGNEGYQARVQSDLDTLAAIEPGQAMFRGLEENGRSVKIKSVDGGNVCYYNANTAVLKEDGTANSGSDSTIVYNRSRTRIGSSAWGERPPIVGMFHEMSHSYDAGAGILDDRQYNYDGTRAEGDAGVKAAELQAVGLGEVTDEVQMNPEGISENDLRAALNLARRERY